MSRSIGIRFVPCLESKYSAAPLKKSRVAASLKELLNDDNDVRTCVGDVERERYVF